MTHAMPSKISLDSSGLSTRQGGYATLAIALVLTILLSLITVFLTRSGILDINTAANRARYAQALADAERRMDTGIAWMLMSANRATLAPASWNTCNTFSAPTGISNADWTASYGNTSWRCLQRTETGVANTVYFLATPASNPGLIYYVFATGTSDDGTANAVVKQGLYFYGPSDMGLPAPMMGAGTIPLNGTLSLVTNPNGAGPGIPISIWSNKLATISDSGSGSAASCQMHEYTKNGNACPSDINQMLSGDDGPTNIKGPDIVDLDSDFPTDLFEFLFGVSKNNYATVKSQATVMNGCSGLGPSSTGIVWAMGDCTTPNSETQIGSPGAPVILVVQPGNTQNGDFRLSAGTTFYGIIFTFDPSDQTGSITLNANGVLRGVVMSNDVDTMGVSLNGTVDVVYDTDLMTIINSSSATKPIARLPGSWADYL
jgi:hypothetical protein